ncbi:MAG: sensor histidine kinase [Chitinophagaceae bacterium]
MSYSRWLLLVLPLVLVSCGQQPSGQRNAGTAVTVGDIRFSKSMYKDLRYEVVPPDSVKGDDLAKVRIDKMLPEEWRRHRVPAGIIEKELLLKFSFSNSSDSTQHIYFYPGAYFSKFDLFRLSADSSRVDFVSESSTPEKYRAGFRLLQLAPGEQSSFIARMQFVRTSATMFYPAALQKDFVVSFIYDKIQVRANSNMITYIVAGVMLMMIFYSVAVYNRTGNPEFLYYSGYAGCLALLFFLKAFLLYDFTRFNFFFESYWDFLVQCIGIGCYFIFIRRFLNTKRNYPFLETTFRIAQAILVTCLSVYTILYFFTSDFIWVNRFENFTKQSLLVFGLIFIIYGIRHRKNKLLQYLVNGNILLLIFSLMSLLMIISPLKVVPRDSQFDFLNSAIIYYEFGLVSELVLFLAGLAYKNKKETIERTRERERLRMDNEKKELEKQMAIMEAQQEERNRISADMHDELGSGVTAIRLMSEIVRTKMKENTLPEIDKISNSANDLITKMNTIIWTMSSSNDTVENLVTYIRTHALEFFESTHIDCNFNIPSTIPSIELSGEKRRNIFLAVKESLNNIVKHAKATTVTIDVLITDKLTISIQDDGVGVDFETIRRFGNGLKNMKSRLERINGKFTIINKGGALTQFEMML